MPATNSYTNSFTVQFFGLAQIQDNLFQIWQIYCDKYPILFIVPATFHSNLKQNKSDPDARVNL